MSTRRRWTPEEKDILARLWVEGTDRYVLMAALPGRSLCAIEDCVRGMGMTTRRNRDPEASAKRVAAAIGEGITTADRLSAHLGIKLRTLRTLLARLQASGTIAPMGRVPSGRKGPPRTIWGLVEGLSDKPLLDPTLRARLAPHIGNPFATLL